MQISIIDGSNYFRGLLLLIRKDRQVTPSEIEMMKRIGKTLGFEQEFCDTAIRDILENAYIEDAPPVFSSPELARKFVKDGLHIAMADAALHPAEEEWLQATAVNNGLDASVFSEERLHAAARRGHPGPLEVEALSMKHS